MRLTLLVKKIAKIFDRKTFFEAVITVRKFWEVIFCYRTFDLHISLTFFISDIDPN